MIIRRETPEEFTQIYDLVKVANEYVMAGELVPDALKGISGTTDCC